MDSKKKVILFHGVSGTGKTTCSNYLQQEYKFTELHPFGFYKRWLEAHYDSPDLDSTLGKEFVPKGMEISMQQLMVDCFHFWEPRDPYFTTRNLSDSLDELVTDTSVEGISLVSFRNKPELEALFNCLWGYQLTPTFINLTRPNVESRESSDIHSESLWRLIKSHYEERCFELVNDGDLKTLYSKLDELVSI